jgi:nicotinamidase-related amidase
MTTQKTTWDIPPFVDLARNNRWDYSPNENELAPLALDWGRQQRITPAGKDETRRIHLLVIDEQKDFCHKEGSLYVAGRSGEGAVADNARLAAFIYHNLGAITHITSTMDTHFFQQIFFPDFWRDENDAPLAPGRIITVDDVHSRRVRPNPRNAVWLCDGDVAWLNHQCRYYVEELARKGKYQLMIWPWHCLLGTPGHNLVGIYQEARVVHSAARSMQTWTEPKGMGALTEFYSVIAPEVMDRWDHLNPPLGQINTLLLAKLQQADALIIAGQAASHCVAYTIADLLERFGADAPAMLQKIYVMRDCMSAVVLPQVDFTQNAEEALQRFADAKMHVVESTQPLDTWPDFPHA